MIVYFSIFAQRTTTFATNGIRILRVFTYEGRDSRIKDLFPDRIPRIARATCAQVISITTSKDYVHCLAGVRYFFPIRQFGSGYDPILFYGIARFVRLFTWRVPHFLHVERDQFLAIRDQSSSRAHEARFTYEDGSLFRHIRTLLTSDQVYQRSRPLRADASNTRFSITSI